MRKLIIYPNCSKGGVSSVIRGRARYEPDTQFDVLFLHDRGGRQVFDDLTNVTMRIVDQGRIKPYLQYITKSFKYDDIHVLSSPDLANLLSSDETLSINYEFHSSNMTVVEKELAKLELDRISVIQVPSEQMKNWVSERVINRLRRRIEVTPNLVDNHLFSTDGTADFFDHVWPSSTEEKKRPLVWVGRFDRDKGYQYFIRMLALLPEEFTGVVIVSLEHEPQRTEKFLAECDAMGVRDRIQLYMNLSQEMMSNVYRSSRERGGTFVSTSLMESFGYAVEEASSCGLPVAAFNLPVWDRLQEVPNFQAVPPGEVFDLADAVVEVTGN